MKEFFKYVLATITGIVVISIIGFVFLLMIIGAIVASIVENLDKVDVAALLRKLMSRVTKGAYAIDFDQEFAGNYSALYSLVVEVLKVNYGDVLKKLGIGVQAQNQG